MPAMGPAAAWPTYHRTGNRTGYYPGLARPRSVTAYWAPVTIGQVYAQPLVVGNNVIVATERNFVYAFSLATKRLVWRAFLGNAEASSALPCGNIGPYSGVTGTPVYDQASGNVFVVAETTGAVHTIWALSATTGRAVWHRNADNAHRDRLAEQQRGALALANGRIYVPFGGRYGDCGNYVGYVISYQTNGVGLVALYQVPTAVEGGIWTPPGPSVAPDGSIYVSVGNGASTDPAHYDGSDSVLHLSRAMAVIANFHPTDWSAQNGSDLDLGSSGPMLLPGGRVIISGKAGDVYLLNQSHLTVLAHLTGCAAYGGDAYDPVAGAAFLPCDGGLQRFNVGANSLAAKWSATDTGSPVIAGGYVWYQANGTLSARDEATGMLRVALSIGNAPHFSSPVVVPGYVIVGTMAGISIFRTT